MKVFKNIRVVSEVVYIGEDYVNFKNGWTLTSDHPQDCCESHYLNFGELGLKDFEGLLFSLGDKCFERVEGYGIRLLPINGHPVSVPGYGYNNGYYSSEITLEMSDDKNMPIWVEDITECQVINEG